ERHAMPGTPARRSDWIFVALCVGVVVAAALIPLVIAVWLLRHVNLFYPESAFRTAEANASRLRFRLESRPHNSFPTQTRGTMTVSRVTSVAVGVCAVGLATATLMAQAVDNQTRARLAGTRSAGHCGSR